MLTLFLLDSFFLVRSSTCIFIREYETSKRRFKFISTGISIACPFFPLKLFLHFIMQILLVKCKEIIYFNNFFLKLKKRAKGVKKMLI